MEYVRTAEREFTAGETISLDYEGRSGNIVVEGGEGDRVRVQVVAHIFEESADAAQATMDRIVAGVRMDGETLRIVPPRINTGGFVWRFNRGPRIDYAVTVPQRARCRLASSSGRVEVVRIAGPLEVTQKSGRTSVRLIEGSARIESKSGSVDLESVGGNLAVQCASGRVSAEKVGGEAKLSSNSGSVKVEQVGGSLLARSHSGRIEARDVGGNANLATHSGRLSIEGARGNLTARSVSGSISFQGQVFGAVEIATTSGSIHFDVDTARPFFLDAETVSGSIRSDLPPRPENGPPPEGAPTVKLRTVSGGIRLGPSRSIHIGFSHGPRLSIEFDEDFTPDIPDIDIDSSDIERHVARTIEVKMAQAMRHAERATERAQRHAERASERAQRHAERAQRHAERHAERARRRAAGEDIPEDDEDLDIDIETDDEDDEDDELL